MDEKFNIVIPFFCSCNNSVSASSFICWFHHLYFIIDRFLYCKAV